MRLSLALSWFTFTFLVSFKTLITSGFGLHGNTPPVFDFRREWLIPENEPIGSRIITVRTKDEEKDTIVYGIEPAVFLDGSNYFTINPNNGDVFLKESLKGQAGNDYYLFVTANDGHQTAKIEVYTRVLEADRNTGAMIGNIDQLHQFNSTPGLPIRRPIPPFVNVNGPIPHSRPKDPNFVPAPPRQSSAATASAKKKIQLPKSPYTTSTNSTAIRFTNSTQFKSVPTVQTTVPPSSFDTKFNEPTHGPTLRYGHGLDMMTAFLPLLAAICFAPIAGVVFWILHQKCQKVTTRNLIKSISHKKVHIDKSESSETSISSTSGELDYNGALFQQIRSKRALSNRYALDSEFPPSFNNVSNEDRKWEFPRHHLHFIGILGEGCFGQVWKCEALNICNHEGAQIVAVKTLKENATEKEKKDLVSELSIMKMLEPHPNVITLYGSCSDKEPVFVIMEYAPFGKLQSYLRESRIDRIYRNLNGQLTSRDLTSFAYQIAKGMEYLSNKGIIHRDLAARNILIGCNKTCKIADFGFAKDIIATQVYERKSEGRLPIRWMAIESLVDSIFTVKSDVWSFGILMWEIVTLGSTPYPGLAAAEVIKKVRDGYRLEKPDHCKREMYNIMFYCWNTDPNERPSFSELVQVLDKLLISENDYIELDRFPDHSYYNIITNLSGEKL